MRLIKNEKNKQSPAKNDFYYDFFGEFSDIIRDVFT